jgi:hypothetical protein
MLPYFKIFKLSRVDYFITIWVVVWMDDRRKTAVKEKDDDGGVLMTWCFG